MDTRLLRYFLAILDEGSITRAAEALHMTQPPLSSALVKLEKDLGVQLLRRVPKGIEPTMAGLELAKYARELLTEMGQVRERLQRIDAGAEGSIALSVVPPYLWGLLPEMVRRLVDGAPDLDVSVDTPPPLEVIEHVRFGRSDAGVVAVSDLEALRERFGRDLHVAPGGPQTLVAVLPPRFAGAPDPFDLRKLDGETWIVPRTTLGVRTLPEIMTELWKEHHIHPGKIRLIESLPTGLPLVSADLGVSLYPSSAHAISNPGVILRRVQQEVPALEYAVIWKRNENPSAVLRRFLDIATL